MSEIETFICTLGGCEADCSHRRYGKANNLSLCDLVYDTSTEKCPYQEKALFLSVDSFDTTDLNQFLAHRCSLQRPASCTKQSTNNSACICNTALASNIKDECVYYTETTVKILPSSAPKESEDCTNTSDLNIKSPKTSEDLNIKSPKTSEDLIFTQVHDVLRKKISSGNICFNSGRAEIS